MFKKRLKPKISVIVNFYNMRREAARTLYSLTTKYQTEVVSTDYEVIAIDNGSSEPLDESWVKSHGKNFKYVYFNSKYPSPCQAINYAATTARSNNLMIMIDGARILSPGIIKYMLLGLKLYEHPFVYTLGMHLGHKLQNHLVKEGYNQTLEDTLLSETNWKEDGYNLFTISSLAGSSSLGYFSPILESNCFALKKKDFFALGGFNEKFVSPGGGLVNLDFLKNVLDNPKYNPIMILGEATFHQFHGGVATNVTIENHPFNEMAKEYKKIRNKDFNPSKRLPEYIGKFNPHYHAKLMVGIATD